MSIRHLSRSIVLQSLFTWDFEKEINPDIRDIYEYNIKEFAAGLEDKNFIKSLVNGILNKKEEIDKIIQKAAPEWPLEQISIVDRNVLRIGLYELLFGDYNQVPPKVAINEAIELAKTFGGETSSKFVNGVLGAVYKEIEEDKKQEFKKEKILKENLGGAVVFKKEKNSDLRFALVHDIFGYWTLSKGKLNEGEDIHNGVKREIKEELGIEIDVLEILGENSYIAYDPKKGKILKNVMYFLAEAKEFVLKLGTSGGLNGVKWFKAEELTGLNIYNDILPFLTKAIEILATKS